MHGEHIIRVQATGGAKEEMPCFHSLKKMKWAFKNWIEYKDKYELTKDERYMVASNNEFGNALINMGDFMSEIKQHATQEQLMQLKSFGSSLVSM